jgi:leucyl aminopeptidase
MARPSVSASVKRVSIEFVSLAAVNGRAAAKNHPDTIVILAGEKGSYGQQTTKLIKSCASAVAKAAAYAKFKGTFGASFDLFAPQGLGADRLLVVGTHQDKPPYNGAPAHDFVGLGGAIMGKLSSSQHAQIVFDADKDIKDIGLHCAELALGCELRAYEFNQYKSKKSDMGKASSPKKIIIASSDPEGARKAYKTHAAISEGVALARTLVNEPPNILTPDEFARRAKALTKLGVEVKVLDVPAMQKLGMGALLGVGQGSAHPSRCVIMRWNGTKASVKPVAFIGKGVTFDTGGISIKPAAGMEDMKGDMAGAACVVGLMHALASRKAKTNVIGAIGLVENMPDGKAQRPGDIVTTLSGQTIEIINTDAEGRLVLADVLWYVQQQYKPSFMINLATLTGAILIALGQEYAGLFSNNDELSSRLTEVGLATGEKVWRMPMGPAFDKMIDSKFADMKNTGGRYGGSITAAQLLQRFVNNVPWAHLDIAGTAMSSPASDINQSWGSGWGVRLLDRLIATYYEK